MRLTTHMVPKRALIVLAGGRCQIEAQSASCETVTCRYGSHNPPKPQHTRAVPSDCAAIPYLLSHTRARPTHTHVHTRARAYAIVSSQSPKHTHSNRPTHPTTTHITCHMCFEGKLAVPPTNQTVTAHSAAHAPTHKMNAPHAWTFFGRLGNSSLALHAA